jgi:hypothetical protein
MVSHSPGYRHSPDTAFLLKTQATIMPGYHVMARLPNDELVINIGAGLPDHSTLVLNVLPKNCTTIVQFILKHFRCR